MNKKKKQLKGHFTLQETPRTNRKKEVRFEVTTTYNTNNMFLQQESSGYFSMNGPDWGRIL